MILSKPLAQPKSRPKLLDRRESKAAIQAEDRRENQIVKRRSQGRCELVEVVSPVTAGRLAGGHFVTRCAEPAAHIHHLISGIGRRNRGKSIKAEHKLHVSEKCHREIHAHVLKPLGKNREDAASVVYERVK